MIVKQMFHEVFKWGEKPVEVLGLLTLQEREELVEILTEWLNGFKYLSTYMGEILSDLKDQFPDMWEMISPKLKPEMRDKIEERVHRTRQQHAEPR